jgi:multiple antibiotic resistance protein
MGLEDIDIWLVIDLFVLLLIGMGPKVALVPFLDLTEGMEADIQKKVARRMVQTAIITALILVALGGFLMKLLHFTPGALNVAGGIVLLLLGLHMLVSPSKDDHHEKASGRDAMNMALYPLAVPYLLNPAGIAILVVSSGDANSVATNGLLVVLVLLVGVLNMLIFANIDKLAKHLDPARLAVTEAVFGILLAALAVQMMVNGLAELGIIDMVARH